jgi:aminopeptidase
VRTSKPGFPFQRELLGAYFRFEQGEVVEWQAEKGQEVLDELFQVPGARRLGEVALVDVRSPINQSGRIFHNTLFDENAVCHVAFGRAYPEGIRGGSKLSQEELDALGLNSSDIHIDLMIGTETMQVIGTCADGSEVMIMEKGMFVDAVLG